MLTPPEKSAFRTDRSRLDRCVEHIAKAICFHTYGIKWQHSIVVASPQLQIASESGQLAAHTPSLGAIAATRDFLSSEPVKGENAEVFLYRIKIQEGTLGFAALFYEYFEIFAASSPGIPGHGA